MFPLLHAAVSFGRLDVLSWMGRTFYNNEFHPFPCMLTETESSYASPMLPVIFHRGIDLQVDDLIEVKCYFRVNVDTVAVESGRLILPSELDGKWMVENWMPTGESSTTMLVYDLRGTSVSKAMGECNFSIWKDSTVQARFENAGVEEIWHSCIVRDGQITKLEFGRQSNRAYFPTSRKLVMTKISDLEKSSIPFKW